MQKNYLHLPSNKTFCNHSFSLTTHKSINKQKPPNLAFNRPNLAFFRPNLAYFWPKIAGRGVFSECQLLPTPNPGSQRGPPAWLWAQLGHFSLGGKKRPNLAFFRPNLALFSPDLAFFRPNLAFLGQIWPF